MRVGGERTLLVQGTGRWLRKGSPPGGLALSEPLPQLLDAKALQAELGVTRAAAEKIMQSLPIVQVPGLRKVYVRRSDVETLLERCTHAKDQVPA
jgi:hypothetical protein